MSTDEATQALIHAAQQALPTLDPTAIAQTVATLLRGERATLAGNAVTLTLGEGNNLNQATINVGALAGRDIITVQLPQPLDPMLAALALFASMPLDHVPEPTTILPPTSRMLLGRNPHFVGRTQDLRNLAHVIADPTPTVIVSGVATGMGGVGKTSVVVEFAYRYGPYFQGGIFWINCADPTLLPSEIAACAPALGIASAGLTFEEVIAQVRLAWQEPIPRLLIFDNCEDPKLLKKWKPVHGGCRVLATARRAVWPKGWVVPVGILSRTESVELVRRLCPDRTETDADLDLLADALGNLPLALHLSGSYLATYADVTVAVYCAQLTLTHEALQGRGSEESPTDHELHVAQTFALSYDRLDPAAPIDALARWLLACAAYCAPGVAIPHGLLMAMALDEISSQDRTDAILRLRAVGLLEGEAALTLHRLLREFVRARQDMTEVRERVERVLISNSHRISTSGHPAAMMEILPHLRHVADQAATRQDTHVAALLSNTGYYLQTTGDYGTARPLYERALEIHEQALGPTHPDTASSMGNLAELLRATGDYGTARPLYERALEIHEQALGALHPHTARSLNNLALLVKDTGDYGAARPLYERALAIREQVLGPTHPDTATSLNNLAALVKDTGDYGTARPLYERALAIREQVLGPTHPDTATSLNNLALLLQATGDYGAARPLLERALEIHEQALGALHPDTARSMGNLAELLRATGDYGAARPLYERALEIHEQVLGALHPDTATSLNNLAELLRATGEHDAARPLYERALAITEQALGALHPDTTRSLNNLAALVKDTGDYGAARPLLERALAITEQALGADHPHTATSLNTLAGLLQATGDYGAARPLYERALAINEQALGPTHPKTLHVRANGAINAAYRGEFVHAVTIMDEVISALRCFQDLTHPQIHTAILNRDNIINAYLQHRMNSIVADEAAQD